jgi:predicted acylesterase/phospholipase RssA
VAGSADIGVLRALHEEGVPIDLVGGTSQGAFVGAAFARCGAAQRPVRPLHSHQTHPHIRSPVDAFTRSGGP